MKGQFPYLIGAQPINSTLNLGNNPMKTYRFLASFRALVGGIPAAVVHESSAKVHGSFGHFLATQQHAAPAAHSSATSPTTQTPSPKASLSRWQGISSRSIRPIMADFES